MWTAGVTVEIKLRFRIPPMQCGRGRRCNFDFVISLGFLSRPPPPPFRGPPQQFDYQHQRPEFEQYDGRGPPPMVNDYNHGRSQEEEGYGMEEYDMPPEPPIPEPIIPTAMYYELPAGLMAPLVGVSGTKSRRLFALVMVMHFIAYYPDTCVQMMHLTTESDVGFSNSKSLDI